MHNNYRSPLVHTHTWCVGGQRGGLAQAGTSSVPNYRSFQKFWRVKPSQNLIICMHLKVKPRDYSWAVHYIQTFCGHI